MSAAEPSTLALFWAGVVAFSILVYVVLDGFDLGVGILFGTTRADPLRRGMLASIAPFWDGNETWLVVIGATLFAAFPVVYAVFLPAFYLPVLLMLLGLIFRGVAFEFRVQGKVGGLWDLGFAGGSAVVAFAQGAAVGAMIRGITVVDGQYAGGPFAWLAPLPVLCGIGLVLGYALLGACWLVVKCEGELRAWARARVPWLVGGVLVMLSVAFDIALDERIVDADLATRPEALIVAGLAVLAMLGIVLVARAGHDTLPFILTVLLFIAAFVALMLLFWPYMIPYSITVGSAAAPDASLSFLFWGAGLFVLPVIVAYTVGVYWIFRGKLGSGGYAPTIAAGADPRMDARSR